MSTDSANGPRKLPSLVLQFCHLAQCAGLPWRPVQLGTHGRAAPGRVAKGELSKDSREKSQVFPLAIVLLISAFMSSFPAVTATRV